MNRPAIRNSVFDAEMDPGINSGTLRGIYDALDVECTSDGDFTAGFDWGVCIKDRHFKRRDKHNPKKVHKEKEPHYVLEVGEGKYRKTCAKTKFKTFYCDYHSCTVSIKKKGKKRKVNDIIEAPGRWTITLWLPKGSKLNAEAVAKKISDAYAKAMEKELREYEIIHAKKPLPKKK